MAAIEEIIKQAAEASQGGKRAVEQVGFASWQAMGSLGGWMSGMLRISGRGVVECILSSHHEYCQDLGPIVMLARFGALVVVVLSLTTESL